MEHFVEESNKIDFKINNSHSADNFSQGLIALEEILYLSDSSLVSVVDRATYHFVKAMTFKNQQELFLSQKSSIREVLEKGPQEVLENLLLNSSLSQLNIITRLDGLELFEWEKLLNIFQSVIDLASLLVKNDAHCNIVVERKRIKIFIDLATGDEYVEKRREIYSATNKLTQQKIWATFDVFESEKVDESKLILNFDLSHKDDEFYLLEMNDSKQLLLSPSVVNFIVESSNVNNFLDSHPGPCIEIKKNGEVLTHPEIAKDILAEDFMGEVLYFPFMFRPITLITPQRGKMSSLFQLLQSSNFRTTDKKYEFNSVDIKNNYYLDLFDLIAK